MDRTTHVKALTGPRRGPHTREEGLGGAIHVGDPGEEDHAFPVQDHRGQPADEMSEKSEKRKFDAEDGRP